DAPPSDVSLELVAVAGRNGGNVDCLGGDASTTGVEELEAEVQRGGGGLAPVRGETGYRGAGAIGNETHDGDVDREGIRHLGIALGRVAAAAQVPRLAEHVERRLVERLDRHQPLCRTQRVGRVLYCHVETGEA